MGQVTTFYIHCLGGDKGPRNCTGSPSQKPPTDTPTPTDPWTFYRAAIILLVTVKSWLQNLPLLKNKYTKMSYFSTEMFIAHKILNLVKTGNQLKSYWPGEAYNISLMP